jgi:DNA topoisomerase-1
MQRGYVRFEERRFVPTELGKIVDKQLADNFSEIVDVNFTAHLETLLDHVADGKVRWQGVVRNFWGPFSKKLIVADKEMKVSKPKAKETEFKCEKCGSVMVVRESRFGKFIACSTYPTCTYKISLDKQGNAVKPEETGEKCEKCGKPIVLRWGRRGKFLACSGYPDCRFTKSLPQEKKVAELAGEKCENCGKEMLRKRGQFGEFLACSGYPQCKTTKKLGT